MFSPQRLVLRSLLHYWRIDGAVALAAAVAVAVLTGSLLVGASMRGSLRALALDRLGSVEWALSSDLFFREDLAGAFAHAAPAILAKGSVVHADTGARANQVQALGVDADFWKLDGVSLDWDGVGERDAVLNDALAAEIHAKPGDEFLLRLQKPSAAPRETFLGERDQTVVTLRLRVALVIPSKGLARFGLVPSQYQPFNVFVPLATLQRRLGCEARVNTILVAESAKGAPQAILNRNARLEDAGLHLREKGDFDNLSAGDYLALESDRILLDTYAENLAARAFRSPDALGGLAPYRLSSLAYLVNTMRIADRSIPYSMVVALGAAPELKDGEIQLNEWAAGELGARVGDRIALTYFKPSTVGELREETTTLTVGGVLPMTSPYVSAAFAPDFPGITDADKVADWRPPFPLDLSRIRPADEEYWDKYRAAPKGIVSLKTGQALWANRYGNLTSILWEKKYAADVREGIARAFNASDAGLRFRPVRKEALEASNGSSDFSGLFIGFSFFLLVSAAMVIQILFRLGVEGRARQIGLLNAVGFSARQARRLLLEEGACVAATGSVLGALGGIGYAALMIHGLRTWWVGSIGTPFLSLYVPAWCLAAGFAGGWIVAMISIGLAARRLSRVPARTLLAGRIGEEAATAGRRRVARALGALAAMAGVATAGYGMKVSGEAQAMMFFTAGALLLTASLLLFAAWLGGASAIRAERLTLTRLGTSAVRRQPGRSVLVVGLMACATFVIVAVGANRQPGAGSNGQIAGARLGKQSGTGGFALLAESALPMYRPIDANLLQGARVYPLRLRPGDDASCLNLYQATRPRVVGVTDEFVERDGFVFSGVLADDAAAEKNPWLLLRRPLPDGAIPAIGDANTVVWLLHSGLGKDLTVDGARFRFVALLKGSVLQSELTIVEKDFVRLYPNESGWRYFAIDAPLDRARTLETALESALEDFGFDAVSAPEKLNALMAVENTYLSTFQSLGGLGLLLGTLGLALALLRNLLERRAEFALLRAVGYRFLDLLWLALSENVLLLVVGLLSGTVCALVAVAPAVMARAARPPWPSLTGALLGVFLFGLIATAASAAAALRAPLLRTLKEE